MVDPEVDFDNTDPRIGACLGNSEKSEEKMSARPLCWYKPEK